MPLPAMMMAPDFIELIVIDSSVERVMKMFGKLGMFEPGLNRWAP